jgi:hypothetical protein
MRLAAGSLDSAQFPCGDDGLVPFSCPRCARTMVACDDCDVVYADLANLEETTHAAVSDNPLAPAGVFSCPTCRFDFELGFTRNPKYGVEPTRWQSDGWQFLLRASAG